MNNARLIRTIPLKRLRLISGDANKPPVVGDLGVTDQCYSDFGGPMVLVYFKSADGVTEWEAEAYEAELSPLADDKVTLVSEPERSISCDEVAMEYKIRRVRTYKRLRSLPFLSLYAATFAAVVLTLGRDRWGAIAWFPFAVGVTAALAIIPLVFLFEQRLFDQSKGSGLQVVLFFFCSITGLAGLPFLGRNNTLLMVGVLAMSAFFLYAALGTIFQWPGFKPPLQDYECPKCRYDLSENDSGICPGCGWTWDPR